MPDFVMQWIQDSQLFVQHFWEAYLTPYHLCLTLLVVSLILFLWIKIKQRNRVLLIGSTAQGRVEVAQSALEKLIINACEPFANRLKIKFKLKGHQVEAFLKLNLKSNLALNASALEIQEKVIMVLKNHLSDEAVSHVHVCITGLGSGKINTIDPLMKSLDGTLSARSQDENQIP